MGKKVFISYKYADSSVAGMKTLWEEYLSPTTVRDYVDAIQNKIGKEHINKGEKDGEDLSRFKESTIASKLRDRIFDSSVTIVLLSPNMVDLSVPESDQWIPWEISYSLREQRRSDYTSRTNGLLVVVLPDKQGSYQYYLEESHCACCQSITYQFHKTFGIIGKNMFVHKYRDRMLVSCSGINNGKVIYSHDSAFIVTAKWCDFIRNPNTWIEESASRNAAEFELVKNV